MEKENKESTLPELLVANDYESYNNSYNNIILQSAFLVGSHSKHLRKANVTLYNDVIMIDYTINDPTISIPPTLLFLSDIIGVKVANNNRSDNKGDYDDQKGIEECQFICHLYPRTSNSNGKNRPRIHATATFLTSTSIECDLWIKKIQELLLLSSHYHHDNRHLLIIVNPKSGTRKGLNILNNIVLPMLKEQAGLDIEIYITKEIGDATHFIKSYSNLNTLHGIICISGDGVINEIFQGLIYISKQKQEYKEILNNIPISQIPAGTGNALYASIANTCDEALNDPISATYIIAKGKIRYIDGICIDFPTTNISSIYSFLGIEWGIMSDIDLGSEIIRCCGSFRYELAGVWYTFFPPSYHARISYIPAIQSDWEPFDSIITHLQTNKESRITDIRCQELFCTSSNECKFCIQHKYRKDDEKQDDEEEKWIEWENDFTFFWLLNLCRGTHNYLTHPFAHASDGYLDLILWDKESMGLFKRIDFFTNSLEKGNHLKTPEVKYLKVKAVRLEPLDSNMGQLGIDGEDIPMQKCIEIRVIPKLFITYSI